MKISGLPEVMNVVLALCSPGDVSQVWVLVLVNAGGEGTGGVTGRAGVQRQ